MDRRPTSFTLTGFCRGLLKQLSQKLGISQTAVIEISVREKAEREIQITTEGQLIDGQHRLKNILKIANDTARQYVAFIHKEEESVYGVSFPDFPGCVTAGSAPEEAHAMAEEALQFHVDGMIEDGETLPEPTPLGKAFEVMPKVGALAVLLIAVKVPSKGATK